MSFLDDWANDRLEDVAGDELARTSKQVRKTAKTVRNAVTAVAVAVVVFLAIRMR